MAVVAMLMILPMIAIMLFVAAKPESWKEFNDGLMSTLPAPKALRELPKLSAKDIRYITLVGIAVLICAEIFFFAIAFIQ